MKRTQYHATEWKNVQLIEDHGLLLPDRVAVATHRYRIPSISTADSPNHACAYHPSGALVVLRVNPSAHYLKRSMRSVRRGENLEEAVNRWLREAQQKGADGIRVVGLQSTVGNQTINPSVLDVIEVINCTDA